MNTLDLQKYNQNKRSQVHKVPDAPGLSDFFNKEIGGFSKKFGAKEKEAFYSELSLLLATGVDIRSAFDIVEEEVPVKKHKELLAGIREEIIKGKRIYEALKISGAIFSKYEIESVKIGEETGRLAEVLKELGLYYLSAIRLRRQIVGVLTYPLVVIFMAMVTVYFMLSFVVPVFSEIFKQTGSELPAITRFLLDLSEHTAGVFYCFFLVTGCILFLHQTQKDKEWYRKKTSAFILKIPGINKLVQKIYLARFCQSMKLLAGARVVINEALDLVGNMIGYYPIEIALRQVRKEVVEDGRQLNESLGRHSIFPKKLIALIRLSEEVNAPEIIFEKLHQQYSAEIEHQQAVVGKMIEPVFIVVLGLFVGFILVAMYLPMFEMSSGTF